MAQAEWRSKAPSEMSFEELQKAKASLSEKFAEVAQEYQWLQSAITNLDFEVGQRFNLSGAPLQYAGQVPEYPLAQVQGKPVSAPTAPSDQGRDQQ